MGGGDACTVVCMSVRAVIEGDERQKEKRYGDGA